MSVNLKTLKSLGLPNKSGGCIVGTLADNQIVKTIPSQFQNF